MKNNPTVAILLCTYNGEKYIEAQLESILNQSYPNVHCYIHDDGSSDRTVSIIKDYECSYPEVFTKLDYQNMSHGAVVNFMSLINYASANCKEDYFMLSDQDDIWLPAKVSDSVKELQKYDQDNKPALVYCDQQVVDENLHVIVRSTNKLVGKSTEDDSFKRIVFRNTAAGCCMCFNKELLSIASKNQDIKNIPMHDWWVMLIAAIYNNAHYFDSTLMLYRQHGDNTLGVDHNNYIKKTKKYLTNFRTSVANRKEQTRKCKEEVIAFASLNMKTPNDNEIDRFVKVCSKGKLIRCFYFTTHGYVRANNLVLTLFL